MNISILLPYKENYSPEYPGAVSLFVSSMVRISKFKTKIKVYGSTSYKKYLTKNYVNISLNKSVFSCLLYTSPSPRDEALSRMPSSA